jgi:hypothetical protein
MKGEGDGEVESDVGEVGGLPRLRDPFGSSSRAGFMFVYLRGET